MICLQWLGLFFLLCGILAVCSFLVQHIGGCCDLIDVMIEKQCTRQVVLTSQGGQVGLVIVLLSNLVRRH